MSAVGLEPLCVIFPITFYTDVIHEAAPLLFEQVFTPFNAVEE